MDFEFSGKVKDLQGRVRAFLEEYVYPNERRYHDEIERNRWSPTRVVEELKPKARAAGLWNLFLPNDEHGAGRRQYGGSRAIWHAGAEGALAEAAPRRRDSLVFRDDRARGGVLRCNE